jgi:hypothetical protein
MSQARLSYHIHPTLNCEITLLHSFHDFHIIKRGHEKQGNLCTPHLRITIGLPACIQFLHLFDNILANKTKYVLEINIEDIIY